jgi:hypothetical protein
MESAPLRKLVGRLNYATLLKGTQGQIHWYHDLIQW